MFESIDILNIEWPNSDRDLHIVTPVLVYLEKKYDLKYVTKSIFNGYYYLLKYKPKLLVISNFSGDELNHELVKHAYNMGIKVVSFISEGNVKVENIDQFIWGWNKDKRLYVDRMCLWSQRSENLFISKYPQIQEKLVTTGGTGFDRYQLLDFKTKEQFLKENNLNYRKVIGIAAWGFDHLYGDYYQQHKQTYINVFGATQINMHRDDLSKLQKIYKELIEENEDTLFILRYHPGTVDFEKNEFFGLDIFENVFISSRYKNRNYRISDLINVSDIWIGYETTTAMEAWLLGKQTFLINPTRSDFIRENVYKGSPIVKTTAEAQNLINEYFKTHTIKSFDKLKYNRDSIIKDVILCGDGQNYIRASKEIIKVLNEPNKKIRFDFKIYFEAFRQISKIVLSKTILRKRWPNLDYTNDFSKYYQDIYSKVIDV